MITREQALRSILDSIAPLEVITRPLEKTLGWTVASDICAGESLPAVDRSAMDGFAIRSDDAVHAGLGHPVRLKVIGEIHPSTKMLPTVKRGQTVAIMTGGGMPPGADAVIKQEDIETAGDTILLQKKISAGHCVSMQGEHVEKGDVIAKKGTAVTPAVLSVLASLRITEVPVTKRPTVGVLAIGNELIDLHENRDGHKIVASNIYLLSALIASLGARVSFSRITKNNKTAIRNDIKEGLKNDALITTGGTSHSHSDLTRMVMEEAGIDLHIAGVSMTPGKGTLFGLYQGRPIFALPGTPTAVFTTFHVLVRPALKKLMGYKEVSPDIVTAIMEKNLSKKPGLEHLVQAVVVSKNGKARVRPLVRSEAKVLSAMNRANGLILVPPDHGRLVKDMPASVLLLDGPKADRVAGLFEQAEQTGQPRPPCISIVGKSNAGKTTFLEKLIPELKQRGYRVGTIKHDVHGFEVDREGKDSWRHKQAGAATVAISAPRKVAVIRDVVVEKTLHSLLVEYFQDRDIVLTEGYKKEGMPKVEIYRHTVHAKPLCRKGDNLVAIVSDTPLDLGVPHFELDDIGGVADLLEKRFLTG